MYMHIYLYSVVPIHLTGHRRLYARSATKTSWANPRISDTRYLRGIAHSCSPSPSRGRLNPNRRLFSILSLQQRISFYTSKYTPPKPLYHECGELKPTLFSQAPGRSPTADTPAPGRLYLSRIVPELDKGEVSGTYCPRCHPLGIDGGYAEGTRFLPDNPVRRETRVSVGGSQSREEEVWPRSDRF